MKLKIGGLYRSKADWSNSMGFALLAKGEIIMPVEITTEQRKDVDDLIVLYLTEGASKKEVRIRADSCGTFFEEIEK